MAAVLATPPAPSSANDRPGAPAVVTRPRVRSRANWSVIVGWLLLAGAILITLFPFYWMLRTAFSNGRIMATDPSSLLPVGFTWGAFARVLGLATPAEAMAQGGSGAALNFWHYLINSVIISTIITVCQTFFSAMAGYAFSRLRWPGRNIVFSIFLAGLMIPSIFTMLPNFILIKNLGLLNTYLGIMLPSLFLAPFSVFFFRQFFLGLSREVEEAAMIDGAGRFRIFFRITLPMSTGPVTTLALLTYIGAWNDYLWPLLVGSAESVRPLTVAVGIFKSQNPNGSPDWPGLMAATLIAALPILVIYGFLGKRIVNSLGFSGVK